MKEAKLSVVSALVGWSPAILFFLLWGIFGEPILHIVLYPLLAFVILVSLPCFIAGLTAGLIGVLTVSWDWAGAHDGLSFRKAVPAILGIVLNLLGLLLLLVRFFGGLNSL